MLARVRKYREGDSFSAVFRFFDDAWGLVTPTTARYRIDCLDSGVVVRDWTSTTAGQVVTIAVESADNKIQDDGNWFERKQMVVQGNFGTASQRVLTRDWVVENLRGVA
jgi:hypothetical protein